MTIYEKPIICYCTFMHRFPHLLTYHGPEEHDLLAEEFLEYQTMPSPPLQHPEEFQIESFWADVATGKDKVKLIFVHQEHSRNNLLSLTGTSIYEASG